MYFSLKILYTSTGNIFICTPMGHLIKIIRLVALLLTIGCSCAAQWQVSAFPQLVKMSIIDNDFSSNPFSSIVPGAGVSLKYDGARFSHLLSFSYIGGSLRTGTTPKYRLDQDYITIDYTGLYKFGEPGDPWTGGAGGALQVLSNNRRYADIINNNTSFDFAASLALAGSLTYSFNNSTTGWSISDQLGIPIVSWLVHPDDRRKMAGFSSFLRLKNTLSLDKRLCPHGTLALAYSWDYYKIKDLRDVRQASHCLYLIYRLTL